MLYTKPLVGANGQPTEMFGLVADTRRGYKRFARVFNKARLSDMAFDSFQDAETAALGFLAWYRVLYKRWISSPPFGFKAPYQRKNLPRR